MAKYSNSDSRSVSDAVLPFQREYDLWARQSIFMAADLLVEALEQTARVLRRGEELGKQLNVLVGKGVEHRQDLRHNARLHVKDAVQDGVEICTEIIQGVGKVIRTGLDEAIEIRQYSEKLQHSLQDSWQDLPNPFRAKTAQKTSRSKEPTIIPISIQDN